MTFLKKIMLVNHEPHLTEIVRCALEETGKYLIKVEQDSRLALHSARWFLPDLILLDAVKAEAEDKEVIQQLQADASLENTPFLYLSGTMASGGFVSGYSFLTSPIRVEEIVRCVDEMLNFSSAANEETTTR